MSGGRKYIDMEISEQELKKYPIKYKNIEDYFLKNDGIIDLMVQKEIDAIREFREDVFIRCGNFIKQPIVFSRKSDEARIFYDPKAVSKMCKGALPSTFHAHGIYPATPSDADLYGHQVLFEMKVQDGMILGIDGVYAQTKHNHIMKFPWSDAFYERLEREGMHIIDNVKNVSCIRMSDSDKRECSIDLGNGYPKKRNIFDEVVYKEPSLDYDYKVLNADHGMEKIKHIDFSAKKTTCVISESQNKRFLSCFQRDVH